MGLAALGGMLAVLGVAQFVGALALSGLSVAAVTALGDVVQDRHFQPWTGWTAAAVAGLAVLGAALGVLGLLEPPKVWASGTWSHVDAYVPAIAPAILAIGGGSYGALYAVAGICAVIGAFAVLPVKRVR
jgi:hypothetical protein